MYGMTVNLRGPVQIQETFRDVLIDRPQDLTPVWARILLDFYLIEAEVYAAQGAAHGGTKWPELDEQYAAWKQRHFPGAQIGVLTGMTREALTGPGAASILEMDPQRLAMGASWQRGEWDIPGLLDSGTEKMPARDPIPGMLDSTKSRWVGWIGDHLIEEVHG